MSITSSTSSTLTAGRWFAGIKIAPDLMPVATDLLHAADDGVLMISYYLQLSVNKLALHSTRTCISWWDQWWMQVPIIIIQRLEKLASFLAAANFSSRD